MAYEKQNWISYDDNKTEEQNIQDGAVVTAERMNHLETGLDEHDKNTTNPHKVTKAQVGLGNVANVEQATKTEFESHASSKTNPHSVTASQVGALTAEESSANVIYQLIGKEKARLTLSLDFKDKVAGSDVENPHFGKRTTSGATGVTNILKPNEFQGTLTSTWYEGLGLLDGNCNQLSANNDGAITQELFAFNIVEALKRQLGENFFELQGAVSLADQVAIIRNIVRASNSTIWGFGSGKNGNRLYQRVFNRFSMAWQYSQNNTASTIQPLNIPIPDNNTHAHVMDDGFIYVLAYTDSSDGTAPSVLNIDYVRLVLEIEVSGYEIINYLIAANHVENLATQAEAEAGASDSKSMSPLRSKQQIDKRVATDTEILAGTDKTKLVTPYSSKLFYDQQEKNRSKFLSVRTKYAAHRGNNSVFPENSLEAFKSVTRHEFFECDVQVTKDSEWIVMHDATVDRTTNGTGNVKDLTYSQIRALKIDTGANIANLKDWQKIVPDLSEVCQCARYGKTVPIIEIKGGSGEVYSDAQLDKFMDTLYQFRMLPDGVIVISFDSNILARLRQRSNELEMMWVQNNIPSDGLEICKSNRIGIDISYSSSTLTKENITAFHKAGLMVGTWTTPENEHQKNEGLGVDIITTNSKSGFLRVGNLALKNGFTGNTSNGLQNYNTVEEISPGQVRAYFNVLNGSNTSGTLVASLPDWAVPLTNSWQFCNIRTNSGSILATANVMGKTADGEGPGIWVGLNWDQRTTWAAGILHWSLY